MAVQQSLSQDSLHIDPHKWCTEIEQFIQKAFLSSKKKGILVTLSGGLDSSVTAALAVRAIGKENVMGLLLPERWGNPDAIRYGYLISKELGIRADKIYINPILRGLKVQSLLLALLGGREYWKKSIDRYKEKKGDEVQQGYITLLRGGNTPTFQRYLPKINGRQRSRLLYACKFAEEHNLLLAGAAHKTERSVGLFVKFGIDDSADIMPLKNAFRSQIVQIANYIGIPPDILNRTPNPDMIPGVTDKYVSYLELSAFQLDLVLLGLERNWTASSIAAQTGIREEKVLEIEEIVRLTEWQRISSLAPVIPF